jgi:hypothetical protein
VAIALQVVEWATRLVDRDLMEVWSVQALELGVLIGEEPPLQQGIIGEIDSSPKRALVSFSPVDFG